MMSRSLPRQTSGSRAGSGLLRRRVAVPLAAVVSASCCWSLPTLTFAHPGIEAQLAHVSGEIARSPESAELYLQRGHLHRVHRDWQKGLADFRQAAELDPDLHRVDRAIGRLYLEADKPQQALAQLEQFLARQPGDPDGLILRGRALGKSGATLKAAADFDAALPKLRGPPSPNWLQSRLDGLTVPALGEISGVLPVRE